ncbi:hypothetical protein SYNPS1DRAFT_22295 [Syncephalis pseudoplumigaleata]|uniref:Uncharacterized protein n=1 Tax=Syncephalis pseudoplumigaleata TaxID=1712513 RepID=A0A4P9Z1K1_9FUNG|nr:hypothetical protein SYNPS1DRAFT_22295 [Syncephalis pseudoplumigaleata]|eukprot:RKP25822.1 hypothetical protein SYNPS1DRAFT_22295 [Syncephalis pseudoplumigaleata]
MTIGYHQRALLRFFGGDAARLRSHSTRVDGRDGLPLRQRRRQQQQQRHAHGEESTDEQADLFGFFRPFAVGTLGYLGYDAFLDDDEYAFSYSDDDRKLQRRNTFGNDGADDRQTRLDGDDGTSSRDERADAAERKASRVLSLSSMYCSFRRKHPRVPSLCSPSEDGEDPLKSHADLDFYKAFESDGGENDFIPEANPCGQHD